MVATGRAPILTINAGSSSLKAAFYDTDGGERRIHAVQAERIGQRGGRIRIEDRDGAKLLDRPQDLDDHASALRAFLEWRLGQGLATAPQAIGHRIVHGGSAFRAPHLVTSEVLAELHRLAPIDPDHLPQALAVIAVTTELYPGTPQVACFDTAFHRSMPRVAQLYALPANLAEAGIIRYGFHGLSCEYIVDALGAIDREAANGRVIVAHLGNGASMTAIQGGASVDTTMGFTPTGGLVMGTRSGDLDPGVLLHLLHDGMTPTALDHLVHHEAGMLGVSGASGDMRDLLDQEPTDPRAADAVALFCYVARKSLGGLVAVLGGLDTLVFTAGIGEHAAQVRERICAGLECFGVELDPARNARHAPIISRDGSRAVVRVMTTDEDRMIARHVARLIAAG